MTVIEMQERRARIYERMKNLHEGAERRNVDLTKTQEREWKTLDHEFDTLGFNIAQAKVGEVREQLGGFSDNRATVPYAAGEWLAAELRGLVGTGVTGGGAYTPAQAAAFFFDKLSAMSVGLLSGFRVIPTDRDSLLVPRLTADVTSSWVSEGGTISSSDATADIITAVPRKLAAIEAMSNEVIDDSEPSILDVVGMSLIRSIALKFDLAAFEGSGTPPEPRGLKNVSGISTISLGTNGGALSNLDPFADAIGALEAENASATAMVMSPRSWKALLKLKEQATGNNKPLLQIETGGATAAVRRSVYGVPVYLSSQLSITETQGSATDASSVYVYQADQVVTVMRNTTRVERDSSRLFNSDQSELRAIMRVDLAVPNPKSVVRILGIIP
jgi:HK97 family phage major capsid protein